MRWLLAAVLLAFAAQAQAQTTTFHASDCDPHVAISNGGLTVTATLNPNNSEPVVCQANVGKYSGKWYYQVIPTTVGWSTGVGLSNPGWAASTANAQFGAAIGNNANSVGYVLSAPGGNVKQVVFGPNAQRVSATFTYTTGNTISVAVDMDFEPAADLGDARYHRYERLRRRPGVERGHDNLGRAGSGGTEHSTLPVRWSWHRPGYLWARRRRRDRIAILVGRGLSGGHGAGLQPAANLRDLRFH